MEIKNKLTVTTGEEEGEKNEKGQGEEHVQRLHGQRGKTECGR